MSVADLALQVELAANVVTVGAVVVSIVVFIYRWFEEQIRKAGSDPGPSLGDPAGLGL